MQDSAGQVHSSFFSLLHIINIDYKKRMNYSLLNFEFRPGSKIVYYLLIYLFIGLTDAIAQKVVSGKVTDENGQGLPGAYVLVKGDKSNAITDVEGKYQIKVLKESAILLFSYVGYQPQEVIVGNQSTIDVSLKAESLALNEIVVVGYGKQKRSDLTGAISSISSDKISVMPVPTFDLALQGRAAGLQITSTSAEPGGGTSMRIRGSNSVNGNNEPLIVLDGYPLPVGGEASSGTRAQSSNVLGFLNPSEIESVEVLKDASATAIYGSRGANGVIVITTKKGKSGKDRINLNIETGINEIPSFPALSNGPDFANYYNESLAAQGLPAFYDGSSPSRPLPINAPTTDWVDLILRRAMNRKLQFDASGGSDKLKYFFSTDFLKNEGIVKNSQFERNNLRLNVDAKLNNRLSLSTSINYSTYINNRSEEGNGSITNSGAIWNAYKANPTAPSDQKFDDPVSIFFENPLNQVLDRTDNTFDQNIIANVKGTYIILPGLTANVNVGNNSKDNRRERYYPKTTLTGRNNNGLANINQYSYSDMIIETYLTYDKSYKEHNLNVVGGISYQKNQEKRLNNTIRDFPSDVLGVNGVSFGLDPSVPFLQRLERILSSYYARTSYNFANKYYLGASIRADGSSVFSQNEKWGYFPSVSGGWTISKESFMESLSPIISSLKLRGSYGLTGSQSIAPLQSLALLAPYNAVINGSIQSGIAPGNLAAPNLKWETTKQYNIGLDFGFSKDRIYGSLDFYKKTTEDLLQSLPIPASSGQSNVIANVGSIENKGVELSIGSDIVETPVFSWNTNLNLSRNISTILDLGPLGNDIFGPSPSDNIVTDPANIIRVGAPFGSFYGYNVIGLIQKTDFDSNGNPIIPLLGGYSGLGSWKFEDIDGDGVVNANDRKIIGDPNPDFIFGWNNDFTYKQFTLGVFIQGSVGNDVLNVNTLFLSGRPEDNNSKNWYDNRWTVENPTNDVRFPSGNNQASLQPNSAIVEDGSYVRLKNVSLSYNLSTKSIAWMNNVRLYVTATNLLTLTNYTGFDPEVNILGQNNLGQGIDFGSYPRSRTYTLGLQIGF